METVIISGVSVINTPYGSFTATSIVALVHLPLFLGTNTITLFTPLLNRLEESSVIRLLLEIMGAVSTFGRYRPYWASIVGACYVARTLCWK